MENKITPPNVVILPTPLNKKAEHVEQSQKHNDDKSKIAVETNNKDTLNACRNNSASNLLKQ